MKGGKIVLVVGIHQTKEMEFICWVHDNIERKKYLRMSAKINENKKSEPTWNLNNVDKSILPVAVSNPRLVIIFNESLSHLTGFLFFFSTSRCE